MENKTGTVDTTKFTPQQLLFCKIYATQEEFFGNGVKSYAKAYGLRLEEKSEYDAARRGASRLLTNQDICLHINDLLEVTLNEQVADKELAFLMTQKDDFGSKLGAIKEFNKLKGRITEKIENTHKADENILQLIQSKNDTGNNGATTEQAVETPEPVQDSGPEGEPGPDEAQASPEPLPAEPQQQGHNPQG